MSSPINLRLRFACIFNGESIQPSIFVAGHFSRTRSGSILHVPAVRFYMLVDYACAFIEVIAEETGKRLVANHGYGPIKFTANAARTLQAEDHYVKL